MYKSASLTKSSQYLKALAVLDRGRRRPRRDDQDPPNTGCSSSSKQIDELDRKVDKDSKEKAVAGFTKLLDKVAEKPDKLDLQPRLLLAQC